MKIICETQEELDKLKNLMMEVSYCHIQRNRRGRGNLEVVVEGWSDNHYISSPVIPGGEFYLHEVFPTMGYFAELVNGKELEFELKADG